MDSTQRHHVRQTSTQGLQDLAASDMRSVEGGTRRHWHPVLIRKLIDKATPLIDSADDGVFDLGATLP